MTDITYTVIHAVFIENACHLRLKLHNYYPRPGMYSNCIT